MKRSLFLVALLFCVFQPVLAQRDPVLKQIDVPHDYYFREMYLPQLTTGPSSVTWSPDGNSIIYSMGGSLWRQSTNETTAAQLTDGSGYDYQPDWSPNGNEVVFTRYNGNSLELQLLNLATGKTEALTTGGHVNLDARFSPNGDRIAYVSTENTGHFRIWLGSLRGGKLEAKPLNPERKSNPRYYYSEWDHQLSPSWSPDGTQLMMVSNPDQIYGTGSIYICDLDNPDKLVMVRKEETAWRTHPDWSPDGHRVVYGSFIGRQWHQLWVTKAVGGGDAFALTFGKFDDVSPRWSRDGNKIAYISNEGGNTSLWIYNWGSGKKTRLEIKEKRYLSPTAQLTIKVTDANGKIVPARISLRAANGKSYAPDNAWMHGDDAFNRSKQQFETYYFHTNGESAVTLPQGAVNISVYRGLEHKIVKQIVDLKNNQTITIKTEPLNLPADWNKWVSADVHVHMNYGGHYRNEPVHMKEQALAEDLDIVFNTVVNKEVRIPDIEYFSPSPDAVSDNQFLLMHSQEHHTSFWGHTGLLGLNDHFIMPGYTTYPNTAIATPFPTNAHVADMAHAQGALMGYVHPFYEVPDPSKDKLGHELPVDVALGKIDYYETVGFSYHLPSAEVWHRLLNSGFRVVCAGGTDAMSNYASLRGPVGMDRTYVQMDENPNDASRRKDIWLQGMKAGKTLATNSALLGFDVNGSGPGSELQLNGKKVTVSYKGWMRSVIPMNHLEIIQNGKVVKTIPLSGDKTSADIEGTLTLNESGWLLLRAWNDTDHVDIQDFYPYATTNPVYIIKDGKKIQSAVDAKYFLAWVDMVYREAEKKEYFTEEERKTTLETILEARKVYEAMSGGREK